MDHERDAASMLAELETRARLWDAGANATDDPVRAKIAHHGAAINAAVIAAVRTLIQEQQSENITASFLREVVIGHGHHRLIATK